MITTRKKVLTKLQNLEEKLKIIQKSPETKISEIISLRYINLIQDIKKNINYYGNIAYAKNIYDKDLGKVSIKRIEEFIQNNLR